MVGIKEKMVLEIPSENRQCQGRGNMGGQLIPDMSLYASPAWFGFLSESCKARCQGVIQKLKRSGYLGNDFESFTTLCEAADAAIFSAILCNRNHVFHQLLPPVKNCNYN